jgi:hypothetical protein
MRLAQVKFPKVLNFGQVPPHRAAAASLLQLPDGEFRVGLGAMVQLSFGSGTIEELGTRTRA